MTFQKGHNPWNKGLTKEDPRVKRNIQNLILCNPGRKQSKKQIEKIRKRMLENNHFKGKKHTLKSRKKMSRNRVGIHSSPKTEFTKESRAKQIFPKKDTSIEVKIQNFLKQLEVDFFTHQYMKIEHGYQCDILVPSMNLVIECDGNYWHKYPVGNDIDHVRTKELINKGFKVLRLWEFEIKKLNIDGFKQKIINNE